MSSTVEQAAQGADKIDPDAYISVELTTSQSTVQVKRKRLELLSARNNSQTMPEETKQRHRSRSRSNSPNASSKKERSSGHRDGDVKPRKSLKWVKEGIQVRIVSKKVLSGKLYNKVLPVTTVLDQYSFEVFSDELNRPITDLREKDIETVLPRSKDIEREIGNR